MVEKKTKLAENKTKPTAVSVDEFLSKLTPDQKREDSLILLDMMKNASKEEPILWSNSFVGFGIKRHKSAATGREADWMRIGFAPRKANFSLYFGVSIEAHTAALDKLGKHKVGIGCLYVNKLADIDLKVLEGIINESCRRE